MDIIKLSKRQVKLVYQYLETYICLFDNIEPDIIQVGHNYIHYGDILHQYEYFTKQLEKDGCCISRRQTIFIRCVCNLITGVKSIAIQYDISEVLYRISQLPLFSCFELDYYLTKCLE